MATAPDNADRLPRASKAQIASLRRSVTSAGEELEREQEESVFTLARALGQINEEEAWAYLDERLTSIEDRVSRLSDRRFEIEQALASELAVMRTQMAEALDAVGVAGPHGAPSTVSEDIDAIRQDVQKTLTSAGVHFSKRFKALEEKWERQLAGLDSITATVETKAAAVQVQGARATEALREAENLLRGLKDSKTVPGFPPAQAEAIKELERRLTKVESQALPKETAQHVTQKLNERIDMLDKAVGHLVDLSEVETARVSELQVLAEGLNDAMQSLKSRIDSISQTDVPSARDVELLRERVDHFGRTLPLISENSARLAQVEGPALSALQATVAEMAQRLESLEVRAAFTTDIIPGRRRRR